jgi:hypothetical protein
MGLSSLFDLVIISRRSSIEVMFCIELKYLKLLFEVILISEIIGKRREEREGKERKGTKREEKRREENESK